MVQQRVRSLVLQGCCPVTAHSTAVVVLMGRQAVSYKQSKHSRRGVSVPYGMLGQLSATHNTAEGVCAYGTKAHADGMRGGKL
jgi:hypothetical protein